MLCCGGGLTEASLFEACPGRATADAASYATQRRQHPDVGNAAAYRDFGIRLLLRLSGGQGSGGSNRGDAGGRSRLEVILGQDRSEVRMGSSVFGELDDEIVH